MPCAIFITFRSVDLKYFVVFYFSQQLTYRVFLSAYFDGAGATVAVETSGSSEDAETASQSAWISVLLLSVT
jgi:hypothetical protein